MCQSELQASTAYLSRKLSHRKARQGSTEVDARQEEIDNAAARLPVTHLVLCVHGIGQNLIAANIAGVPLAFACAVTHITLLSNLLQCPPSIDLT